MPDMPDAVAPATPEQFQASVSTLRNAPFGAGETQLDRATQIEALYKSQYPEPGAQATKDDAAKDDDGAMQQGEAPGALAVNWGDREGSEVSETDGELRQSMQGYFSEVGFTGEQASSLVDVARRAYATPLTDEEWHDKEIATESQLRRAWGKDYERQLAKAYAMADAFESRFSHADLKKAIDNGLWIDADVLRTLASVANAKNGIRADLHTLRAELLKANQGSPRYQELTTAIERHYKALHGAKNG